MSFDILESKITDMINDRYMVNENQEEIEEMLNLTEEKFKNKSVLQIKRLNRDINRWKTIVIAEIDSQDQLEINNKLKEVINWVALIKEYLSATESTDLYLFLSFNNKVDEEECLRIESTEQICRKYVLLPKEDVISFLNRTFLQELTNNISIKQSEDPIEIAFSNTAKEYTWLTSYIQKLWKKALLDYSGSELLDMILEGEDL